MVKSIVTFNKGDESYTFKVRESFLCDGYEILKCKNLSNEVRNAWDDYFFATESQAIEMIEQWVSKMEIMDKISNVKWHI